MYTCFQELFTRFQARRICQVSVGVGKRLSDKLYKNGAYKDIFQNFQTI